MRRPNPEPDGARNSFQASFLRRCSISLVLVSLASLGATIVVDDDGGTPDLATALASAQAGDTVLVLPGTYVGSFDVPEGVRLLGSGPENTILDGDGADWTVGLSRGAEVSRFTITGGENGIEGIGANKVRENRITGNGGGTAVSSGGGVSLPGCGAEITRNMITGNSATFRGGGIYLFLSPLGGCQPGDPAPVVQNNLLEGNSSAGSGSALAVRDSGLGEWNQKWPVLTQNTIVGNVAGNSRGALYFISDLYVLYAADPTGRVTNNVIAGNTGGGLAQYMDVGYYAGWDYGPRISDNIFWDNGEPELEATSTGIGSDGNMAFDPAFRDPAAGDFRLQPGSPAIDSGAALAEPAILDLDGYPRPLDGDLDGAAASDLGAFEETGEVMGLTLAAGGSEVAWDPRTGATFYNLYRGLLQELLAGGDYTQGPPGSASRQWCDLTSPSAVEDQSPEPGQVYFYLATPGGPAEGSLGFASDRLMRPNVNPCP